MPAIQSSAAKHHIRNPLQNTTYEKRALTLLVSAPYTEAVCGYRSKLIEVIQDGIIIPPSHQVAGIQGITLLIE